MSGTSVIRTSDGGYLALGANISTYLMTDYYVTFFQTQVVKTDSSGNLVWSKVYSLGDLLSDQYRDTQLKVAVQTSDGYVLAGSLGEQAFLVKIDSDGNIIWQKTYELEGINALIQTSDGGYAVVGSLYTVSLSPPQFQIMKVDSQGNLLWHKGYSSMPAALGISFGFPGTPSAILQSSDQGYIITSTEGHYCPSSTPCQMFKLDSNGSL